MNAWATKLKLEGRDSYPSGTVPSRFAQSDRWLLKKGAHPQQASSSLVTNLTFKAYFVLARSDATRQSRIRDTDGSQPNRCPVIAMTVRRNGSGQEVRENYFRIIASAIRATRAINFTL
jgi:hypothetical protein